MIRRQTKGDDVRVTFSLPQDAATGPISVVGDFNDWTPGTHTLVKRANGTRSVVVTLPKGTSARFRYLGENGNWFDDEDADETTPEGSIVRV